MTAFEAGQTVGRYRILRPLGAGAMGVVYLAQDPQIERLLAIKTVRVGDPAEVASSSSRAELEERTQRLLREAKTAGRLIHPNIVTLFDAGEEDGTLFLAFEYVEGESLADRLRAGPPLAVAEALRIAREAAEGLDCAHRRGIVHRDVKPANLLLTGDGRLKISDFGIAKMAGQATELTVSGSVVGSPQYLSPEQIRGEALDGRSDLFSLGVVLYEMVGGRRPFEGETFTTLLYKILHEQPAPIRLRPGLEPELAEMLARMLAKDRAGRYADAAELAAALAELERTLPADVLAAPAVLSAAEVGGVEPTQLLPQGDPAAPETRPGEASGEPAATRPPPPPPPPGAPVAPPTVGTRPGPDPTAGAGPASAPAPATGAVPPAPPATGGGVQTGAAPAAPAAPAAEVAPPRPSRRKLWLALAAAALVVLVTAVVVGVLALRWLGSGGDLMARLGLDRGGTERQASSGDVVGEALSPAPSTPSTPSATADAAAGSGAGSGSEPGVAADGEPVDGDRTPTGSAGEPADRTAASEASAPSPAALPSARSGGPSGGADQGTVRRPAPSAAAGGTGATDGAGAATPSAMADEAGQPPGAGAEASSPELSPGAERLEEALERRPALRRAARELAEARGVAPPSGHPEAGAIDQTIRSGLALAFHVEPAQAFVLVDGTVIGRAAELDPAAGGTAYRLPGAGDYLVKLRAPGMKDRHVLVQASASGPPATTVTARLQPAPAEELALGDLKLYRVAEAVGFEVLPPIARPKARVLVDGRPVGRAAEYPGRFARANTWLRLEPGRHRVSIVAPGFIRRDVAVDVSSGATERRQRIEIVLRPERTGAGR